MHEVRPTRDIRPTVYILASDRNGTLYTGVTANLPQRMEMHRAGQQHSFVNKYGVTRLVYYEAYASMLEAITREKQLKKWRRTWKLKLIEGMNPRWDDLYAAAMGAEVDGSQPKVGAGCEIPVDDALDSRLRGNDGIERNG